MTNNGDSGLVLTRLSKRYGSVKALDDITLTIKQGEFISFLGPSGSGKTSLLMAIAGFIDLDEGTISSNRVDITMRAAHRRNIGVVFQSYALFPHLTVSENVGFSLRMRQRNKSEIQAKVKSALDLVRMPGIEDRRVSQLSGGQQQRVALARALVFDPDILLLDEPLSALDRALKDEMQAELKAIQNRLHVTTVMVTHDQAEALALSDRVAVMNKGRVEQFSTPQNIYDAPATDFVAGFIGRTNCVSAVRDADNCLRIQNENISFDAVPLESTDANEFLVRLRPEAFELVKSGPCSEQHSNATVRDVVFLGDTIEYLMSSIGHDLVIRVPRSPGQPVMETGAQVLLKWPRKVTHCQAMGQSRV